MIIWYELNIGTYTYILLYRKHSIDHPAPSFLYHLICIFIYNMSIAYNSHHSLLIYTYIYFEYRNHLHRPPCRIQITFMNVAYDIHNSIFICMYWKLYVNYIHTNTLYTGTTSIEHPAVSMITTERGKYYCGGEISGIHK